MVKPQGMSVLARNPALYWNTCSLRIYTRPCHRTGTKHTCWGHRSDERALRLSWPPYSGYKVDWRRFSSCSVALIPSLPVQRAPSTCERARSDLNVLAQIATCSLLRLSDSGEREELSKRTLEKIQYVDGCFWKHLPLGNLAFTRSTWEAGYSPVVFAMVWSGHDPCCLPGQDAMKELRPRAASLSLFLRPRLFRPQGDDNAGRSKEQAEDSCPDPESAEKYDKFETLYLPCERAVRGVLQVHKAAGSSFMKR